MMSASVLSRAVSLTYTVRVPDLPTEISENSVGYSGGINVGKVGHEGGFRFCDLAVGCIEELFAQGPAR